MGAFCSGESAGIHVHGGRSLLRTLLHGQFISFLITGTAFFTALLVADGIDIPTVQSSMNYALLSLHLIWAVPSIRRNGLAVPLWKYAVWAIFDVEGNYLVVSAYQYTSVASVMLLDCFTIPCVMALSCVLLSTRYTLAHIVGALICVTGLTISVLSDALSYGELKIRSENCFGDALVLAGAALYGCSNVLQVHILKGQAQQREALGMLGLLGSLISCLQAVAVERDAFVRSTWTPRAVLCVLGFQLCLFGMYVLTSAFLKAGDAALFNLSLLTSDVYSVFVSWGVQHRRPSLMYCAAFVTTMSGLIVYNVQPAVGTVASDEEAGVCSMKVALAHDWESGISRV